MYCIKCGVRLADSETRCPLCGTVVYHPDLRRPGGEGPFPRLSLGEPVPARGGIPFLLTLILCFCAMMTTLIDWKFSGRITWSGYALGGIALFYVMCVLPSWFRRPNPIIFVPVDFLCIGLYLLYIDLVTGGGWFLSFAFPVTGIAGLLVTAIVTLCRCLRRGYLYIFGGGFIALGGAMALLEFFITITFGTPMFRWSLYPLVGCFLIGMGLIVIAICRPLRESLKRKFFI